MPDISPAPKSSPESPPEPDPAAYYPALSSRHEAFCRHFAATGNAAEAARRAGYAEASARQTGHTLLTQPRIVERVRQIRLIWRWTARSESQILLERLEQAWDAAVAAGSASLMLRVIGMQADLSGLSRRGAAQRTDLWPFPEEDEFGELAATTGFAKPGPLERAVRLGRDRAGRALARHLSGGHAGDETGEGTGVESGGESGGQEPEAARRLRTAVADRQELLDRCAKVVRVVPAAGDPKEGSFDTNPLPSSWSDPEAQTGDDIMIDMYETGWMNERRYGSSVDPLWELPEPAGEETAGEEPKAEAPEQDRCAMPDDGDDSFDRLRTGPFAPAPRPEPEEHDKSLHPANGKDRPEAAPCNIAPPPEAAMPHNGNAAGAPANHDGS